MSPKHSSLAFDEIKEHLEDSEMHSSFDPRLDLIVNTRYHSSSHAVVEIVGRVTVSF